MSNRLKELCGETYKLREQACGTRSGTLREREAAALSLATAATELARELDRLACEENGEEYFGWRCDDCGRTWDVFTDEGHPKGRCPDCGSAFAFMGGTRPERCAETR